VSVAQIVAVAIAAVACVYDVRTSRIPNFLTFGAALLAIAFHTFSGGGIGATPSLLGWLIGIATFFPIFALGAMGAGDVKLMGALGAWLGWQVVLLVALYGALAGGVFAIAVALRRRYLLQALRNVRALLAFWWFNGVRPLPELSLDATDGVRLPYALPIAAGLLVTLWV